MQTQVSIHPSNAQEQLTIPLTTPLDTWNYELLLEASDEHTTTIDPGKLRRPMAPASLSPASGLSATLPSVGRDTILAYHPHFELLGNGDRFDISSTCIQEPSSASALEVSQVVVWQAPSIDVIPIGAPAVNTDCGQALQKTIDTNMSRTPHASFIEASQEIIKIMTAFKLMPDHSIVQMSAGIEHATQSLNLYTLSLPADVYIWVENKRRPRIGAPSARSHSTGRRNPTGRKGLYLCLWCGETITAKPNFSNHIRAHLNLHLSFCDYCDFSSVDVRLPRRHNCRKQHVST
ncbi:hypothetical protein BJ165DRAFT_1527018 [Panaeolus papilionaceus]|nr:hypothetical protein BJ165DRAFT_1527018 [Panaeolus papilionaceus]